MADKATPATDLREAFAMCESLLAAAERDFLLKSEVCASDLAILLHLRHHGPAAVKNLAEAAHLTSGSATTAIQRLRKAGHIDSRRSDDDGRIVLIEITQQGDNFARKTAKKREKLLTQVFSELKTKPRKSLTKLLGKAEKALGEATKND